MDAESSYTGTELRRINLLPMAQRFEIKDRSEDWTGKSSTAERRRLQNRLNQRAARRRKARIQFSDPTVGVGGRDKAWAAPASEINHTLSLEHLYHLLQLVKRPEPGRADLCMSHYARKMVAMAPSFASFLHRSTPLPSDQKLLTLLRFNLVRAFGQLVHLVGYTADDMSMDILSRFNFQETSGAESLPPNLAPTHLQRTIIHYADIDVFPYPEYRDNCILAGDEINDVELCNDIVYGVEADRPRDGHIGLDSSGRTGLIVWSDPCQKESWEVDEMFAKKYSRLFKGCQDLIKSTNYWRATRGERPLSLEF